MTATVPPTDEQQLAVLQADYPHWRIWRAQRKDRSGGTEPGSWMATRLDPGAGVDATLMEPTADQLRAALINERQRIARGEAPFAVAGEIRYGGGA